MTAPAIAPASAQDKSPDTSSANTGATSDAGTGSSGQPSGQPAGQPSGPSLGEQIGAMLGTEPGIAETLGIPASKPAETPKPDEPKPDAVATPPADPAAAAPTAADPLAGAQPFTYGEGKTLDGIHVIPGEGALIPEAQLHVLTELAEQRDALDESSRQYSEQVQQYEQVTAFTITGADGKERTVTGQEGVTEMRVNIARSLAETQALRAVLADPQKLLALIAKDGDKFVLDPTAVRALELEVKDITREVEDQVRGFMQQRFTRREAPAPRSAPRGDTTVALEQQAPKLIDAAAKSAGADAKLLTDADRTFLAKQLPRYTRTVTAEDRRFNPKFTLGAPIVDAAFSQVVQDRIGMRQEMAKTASATAKAAEENAARKAAASAGTPPVAPPKPASPTNAPKLSDDEISFKRQEAAAMGKRFNVETGKIE